MQQLYICYHVACMGQYQDIAQEQLALMERSGALAQCTCLLYGVVGGESERSEFHAWLSQWPVQTQCIFESSNLKVYENGTLNALRTFCVSTITDPEFHMLYLHTKGVTAVKCEGVSGQRSWRHYMQFWLVERLLDARNILDTGYLTVGVNMRWDHYSGNFWLARGSHLRTLPPIADFHNRWNAEYWVMRDPVIGRHASIHQLGIEGYGRCISLSGVDITPDMYREAGSLVIHTHQTLGYSACHVLLVRTAVWTVVTLLILCLLWMCIHHTTRAAILIMILFLVCMLVSIPKRAWWYWNMMGQPSPEMMSICCMLKWVVPVVTVIALGTYMCTQKRF